MSRTAARDPARDRLLRSLLLAVLLHAVALVALEVFLRLAPQKPPEYHGPIIVQLEEQPVVQQARQATPRTAAPAAEAPRQAQAGAAAPAAAAEPPLPSGPPLRAAAPAAGAAAAASGSPFRLEGSPAQAGPPRPAGEGFQVSSTEPTLPPAGEPAQGPPLRAKAPGESAAARPGGQTPAVPLEQVDRALASGARQAGAAGAQAGAAGPSGSGAQAAAQSGTGQGEASREGISIVFEKPDRGRELAYQPLPDIPEWVSRAGLRLTVGISFELTPQGVLDKVRIAKSCGYSDVDWAVLVAVRRWKFKPASASAGNVQGTVGYLILPH